MPDSSIFEIRSVHGQLHYFHFSHPSRALAQAVQKESYQGRIFRSYPADELTRPASGNAADGFLGFNWERRTKYQTTAIIPLWSLVLITAAASTLPWMRRRFSLRTLLIATTLIAITLGLTIYMTR